MYCTYDPLQRARRCGPVTDSNPQVKDQGVSPALGFLSWPFLATHSALTEAWYDWNLVLDLLHELTCDRATMVLSSWVSVFHRRQTGWARLLAPLALCISHSW